MTIELLRHQHSLQGESRILKATFLPDAAAVFFGRVRKDRSTNKFTSSKPDPLQKRGDVESLASTMNIGMESFPDAHLQEHLANKSVPGNSKFVFPIINFLFQSKDDLRML